VQKKQEEIAGEAKELEKELGGETVIEDGSVTTNAPVQEAEAGETEAKVNE
jgi:hypothetical protein